MALFDTISHKIALRRRPVFSVNWRRVYALPTRHGIMVGLAVFGVFAISVRIQHNMLLLLSVVLFVIFLISVIWAALNMHALRAELTDDTVLIATEPAQIGFYIVGRTYSYDLRMKLPDAPKKRTAEAISLYQRHQLAYKPMSRGRHLAPPYMVETHFPFGLVRVWQWLSLPSVLVAPSPDFSRASLLLSGNQRLADFENDERGEYNADSLETWQEGIPLSRISWKQYAAKDRLLYKTGAASGNDVVRLHFSDVALGDFEGVLRVLCAGVLLASEAGHPFELALMDGVATRYNADEVNAALQKLALCQEQV